MNEGATQFNQVIEIPSAYLFEPFVASATRTQRVDILEIEKCIREHAKLKWTIYRKVDFDEPKNLPHRNELRQHVSASACDCVVCYTNIVFELGFEVAMNRCYGLIVEAFPDSSFRV